MAEFKEAADEICSLGWTRVHFGLKCFGEYSSFDQIMTFDKFRPSELFMFDILRDTKSDLMMTHTDSCG